jgi:phage shock protein C
MRPVLHALRFKRRAPRVKKPCYDRCVSGSRRKLYRSRDDRFVAGVLGGVADWMGADSSIVRIVFALLALFTAVFPAVVLYVLAALVVPEEPPDRTTEDVPPPALD